MSAQMMKYFGPCCDARGKEKTTPSTLENFELQAVNLSKPTSSERGCLAFDGGETSPEANALSFENKFETKLENEEESDEEEEEEQLERVPQWWDSYDQVRERCTPSTCSAQWCCGKCNMTWRNVMPL